MVEIVDVSNRFGADDRVLANETADCLRKWLEMAERGEIVSVALVGEMTNGDAITGHSAAATRFQTIGALSALHGQLVSMVNE